MTGGCFGRRHGNLTHAVAEDALQSLKLGDVTDRGRRGVRVDVRDVVGGGPRLRERGEHGAGRAGPLGVGRGDVVRVARDRATGELGVDASPAGERVLLRLEHEGGSALAEHEAVTVNVVGARRGGGVVIALRERLHRGKGGDRQRVNDRLGATGNDDVGEAELQVLVGVRDRLGARCARRHDRAGTGPRAEIHADGRGRRIRHEHGDRHREDATRALLAQGVPRVEEGPETADAGGVVNKNALGRNLGASGVGPRLAGRNQCELRGGVEALDFLALKHLIGAHERLSSEGDRNLVLLDPLFFDRTGAGGAGE